MSNVILDKARELFATKQIDWALDDLVLCGIGEGFDGDDPDYWVTDDLPPLGLIFSATIPTVGRNVGSDGILDLPDMEIDDIAGNQYVQVLVVAKAGGHLILYIDTMSGLPLRTNGAPIFVTWPAAGVAKL